jgi:Holliday junction resolvase
VTYDTGRRWEWQVRDWFRARGYVVIRAAGSHGPADLVALRRGQMPVLIACRATRSGLSPAERRVMVTVGAQAGALAVLVDKPARGRQRVRSVGTDGYGEFGDLTARFGAVHVDARGP